MTADDCPASAEKGSVLGSTVEKAADQISEAGFSKGTQSLGLILEP